VLGSGIDLVVCQKSAEQEPSHFRGLGACRDCRFRPIVFDLADLRSSQ
jgi:hypothetical protein